MITLRHVLFNSQTIEGNKTQPRDLLGRMLSDVSLEELVAASIGAGEDLVSADEPAASSTLIQEIHQADDDGDE